MKTIKKNDLKLDKEIIASLSNGELQQINGGVDDTRAPKCNTLTECQQTTNFSLNCLESNPLCKPEDSKIGCVYYSKVNCKPIWDSKQCTGNGCAYLSETCPPIIVNPWP